MTDKSGEKDEAPKEEESPEQDPLAEANARADQYLDMARRLQADFDNFRKRTQRENEEFKKYACAGLIKELLNVLDDLDRSLSFVKEEDDFVMGIKGVRYNLNKTLEANGLAEIPADGKFDPNLHEALCTVDGDEDGMVAEVLQKGYTLNGKVIRFAKVKVTKKKQQDGEQVCQE